MFHNTRVFARVFWKLNLYIVHAPIIKFVLTASKEDKTFRVLLTSTVSTKSGRLKYSDTKVHVRVEEFESVFGAIGNLLTT